MTLKLGQIVMTRGIAEDSRENFPFFDFAMNCLTRHEIGDWGDLCKEDKEANEYAVKNGERVFSSYKVPEGIKASEEKIWIITEWDRSVTTILFPREY